MALLSIDREIVKIVQSMSLRRLITTCHRELLQSVGLLMWLDYIMNRARVRARLVTIKELRHRLPQCMLIWRIDALTF